MLPRRHTTPLHPRPAAASSYSIYFSHLPPRLVASIEASARRLSGNLGSVRPVEDDGHTDSSNNMVTAAASESVQCDGMHDDELLVLLTPLPLLTLQMLHSPPSQPFTTPTAASSLTATATATASYQHHNTNSSNCANNCSAITHRHTMLRCTGAVVYASPVAAQTVYLTANTAQRSMAAHRVGWQCTPSASELPSRAGQGNQQYLHNRVRLSRAQ